MPSNMEIARKIPPKERSAPPSSAETLTSGKEIIGRIIGMIGQAKHSIDLQFYTFEADETGKKVLDALRIAKGKNPSLQIRLLIDNSISFRHNNSFVGRNGDAKEKRDATYTIINQMKQQGIFDAKVTNWFPHNMIASPLKLYSNVLHRDHKKLVCIDSKRAGVEPMAMVTSANIAWYHELQRKEVGRVYHGMDGPVPLLQSDFDYTFENAKKWDRVYSVRGVGEYFQKYGLRRGFWGHLGEDFLGSIARNPQKPGERMVFKPGPKGHDSAVLTDSFYPKWFFGLGAREATDEAFTMLDLAQKGDSVIVFSPYPGIFSLTRHLTQAAKRGVSVHLIISKSYESELMNPKNPKKLWEKAIHPIYADWPKRLTQDGVMLHEYTGKKDGNHGELHAKGALWVRSDGSVRTLIGSTNFSKGPVSGMNREIAVVEESDLSDPLVAYANDLMAESILFVPKSSRRNRKKG